MASAAASASSSYSAYTGAASSNYGHTTTFNNNMGPKFSEYRSRVMLGDLPQDFLRIQITQAQAYDPTGYGMRQQGNPPQQQLNQNPNFLGYFTLTIAEAKLIKNSGLLGLIKMDPYVSFRIGHVAYDTPIASGGGKNPQWKASYRINLFKGMDRINLDVYDQRNFTEDSFIGSCEIAIPREVMEGETRQHWYPLMGRQTTDNQGDILIIMSFVPRSNQILSDPINDAAVRSTNPSAAASSTGTPVVNSQNNGNFSNTATASSAVSRTNNIYEQEQPVLQHSPSAIPKPPPPSYTAEDIRTIEEMFPTTDRRIITDLLDKHGGNTDLVANHLLQNV